MDIHRPFFKFLILLTAFCLEQVQSCDNGSLEHSEGNERNKTLGILKEGENHFQPNFEKNITLVFGLLGSEKNNFLKWIIGDDNKFVSKGIEHGQFYEQGFKKTANPVKSQIVLPEKIKDPKSGNVYYDCPDFSADRNTSYEIATAYFIKKVADSAENIKFIFTVSHQDLMSDEKLASFEDFVSKVVSYLKDVTKFKDGITLAVTKVNNQMMNTTTGFAVVPDTNIIDGIANILQKVRDIFIQKSEKQSNSPDDWEENQRAVDFISILLTKNNDSYSKIAIFRMPDEAEPLNDIERFRNSISKTYNLLNFETEFIPKNRHDLGVHLSKKAKNEVVILSSDINIQYEKTLQNLIEDIFEQQQEYVSETNKTMQSCSKPNDSKDNFYSKLQSNRKIVSDLIEKLSNVTDISGQGVILNESLASFGTKNLQKNMDEIFQLGRYLTFFIDVSSAQIEFKQLSFKNLDKYLSDSLSNFYDIIQNRKTELSKIFDDSYKHALAGLKLYLQELFRTSDVQDLPAALARMTNFLSDKLYEIQNLTNPLALSHILLDVEQKEMPSMTVRSIVGDMIEYGSILQCFQGFEQSAYSWDTSFKELVDFLDENVLWFQFLNDLYHKFSDYDVQVDSRKYNVANMSDWGKDHKPQGIAVTKENIKSFFTKLTTFDLINLELVKKMEIEPLRLSQLNELLSLTLNSAVTKDCNKTGILTVTGENVKLSDFVDFNGNINACPSSNKIQAIDLFAFNSIVFDRNLNLINKGIMLSFIAPKWFITGSIVITLSGNGGGQQPQAANGAECYGTGSVGNSGVNGKVGLPGGNSGHFFGTYGKIINGKSLKIVASGGRGGNGQNGGDGGRGCKGRSPSFNAGWDNFDKVFIRDDKTITLFYNKIIYTYKIYGDNGGKGGFGGNGGDGGLGGANGNITIIKLNDKEESDKVVKVSEMGEPGFGGARGRGGNGGVAGDICMVQCKREGAFSLPKKRKWNQNPMSCESSVSTYDNGGLGTDGKTPSTQNKMIIPNKQYPSVMRYKLLNMANEENQWKRQESRAFLAMLDKDPELRAFEEIQSLISEFLNFELKQKNMTMEKKQKLYFYQCFLNRTLPFSKNPETVKLLFYMHTSIVTKISQLKNDFDGSLIVDITKYIAQLLENMKQVQGSSAKMLITDNYKSSITKKIEEAKNFIKKDVITDIDSTVKGFDKKIIDLILEADHLKKLAETESETLKNVQKDLENQLMERTMFGCFKIFSALGDIFGGSAKIAGSMLESGIGAAEPIFDSEITIPPVSKLPPGVLSGLATLDESLNDLENYHIPGFSRTRRSVTLENSLAVVSAGSDLAKNIMSLTDQLETVQDSIRQVDEKIKQIAEFEQKILKTMLPLLKQMGENLRQVATGVEGKSRVALEVTSWGVQRYLKDFKRQMSKLTEGFEVNEKFQIAFESLEETFATLINIYDLIEGYHEQNIQADYIAAVTSPDFHAINVKDSGLQKAVDTLDNSIRSNLVLQQYQIVVNALKQSVFPLAQTYLADIDLEPSGNLTYLVTTCTRQVEKIKSKLIEYKASISKQDKYLQCGKFNSKLTSTEPFFVWKSSENKKMIGKLLSGEKVLASANIIQSSNNFAVKFSVAELNFKLQNKTENYEYLRKALNGFQVQMTHMGNSYYKFQEAIYIINTPSQVMQYTYEKGYSGNPVTSNLVYQKLKNGDLTLSPYTMWQFQLTATNSKVSFDNLSQFKDKVDLELVGRGCFLDSNVDIATLDVDSYYKRDDTILPV